MPAHTLRTLITRNVSDVTSTIGKTLYRTITNYSYSFKHSKNGGSAQWIHLWTQNMAANSKRAVQQSKRVYCDLTKESVRVVVKWFRRHFGINPLNTNGLEDTLG